MVSFMGYAFKNASGIVVFAFLGFHFISNTVIIPSLHSENSVDFLDYIPKFCLKIRISTINKDFCGLSIVFLMRFYNNAAKIFGAEGVLRRRLEILESIMVYITRGSSCITDASAWVYFFEKSIFARRLCRRLCRKLPIIAKKITFFAHTLAYVK